MAAPGRKRGRENSIIPLVRRGNNAAPSPSFARSERRRWKMAPIFLAAASTSSIVRHSSLMHPNAYSPWLCRDLQQLAVTRGPEVALSPDSRVRRIRRMGEEMAHALIGTGTDARHE